MRNDLSISITEPNLSDPDVREFSYRGVRIHLSKFKLNLINLIKCISDPDVREFSYRGVRIHRSLDLPSNAEHLCHATTQVEFTQVVLKYTFKLLSSPHTSAGNTSGIIWHHW